MSLMFFCFNTPHVYAEPVCPSGYYVASCDGKKIGTNWLKGFYIDEDTHERSPNYYDYAMENNMDNLRYFFDARPENPISYTDHDGIYHMVSADDTGFKTYRDKLLYKYCKSEKISCEKCPNGGKTDASTISESTNPHETIWNLKVISDCYVSKYTDSTGTYEYIDNLTNLTTKTCFYNTEKEGDAFVTDNDLFNSVQHNQEEQSQTND
ncbi:MAG: hypothetical protein MJ165_01395 [Alphaproteobacteria bacterium]|nr:hypothetical protein [Alphaproteobacteria bacterium]